MAPNADLLVRLSKELDCPQERLRFLTREQSDPAPSIEIPKFREFKRVKRG